ncbi:MAG: Nitrogen regulatory protein P-II 2 [Fimbriimonadaceae bacterium]|nr:Nitrogen regulatory protein P-II 2 [Fimbriimonadaceae bacterium]
MIRVTCYIRPHRLDPVKTALASLGITGLTVNDVRGCGNSEETATLFAGRNIVIPMPVRSKVTVFATDSMKDLIIEAIRKAAFTGEPGDGKIFVERTLDAIRIRTKERGETAL